MAIDNIVSDCIQRSICSTVSVPVDVDVSVVDVETESFEMGAAVAATPGVSSNVDEFIYFSNNDNGIYVIVIIIKFCVYIFLAVNCAVDVSKRRGRSSKQSSFSNNDNGI